MNPRCDLLLDVRLRRDEGRRDRQGDGHHHPGAQRPDDDVGRRRAMPPVRVGVPVADLVAPVFGVVGILAALQQRERTGMGQQVDVSMLGVLTSLVASEPFDLLEACGLPQRTGRDGAAPRAVRRLRVGRRLRRDLRADRAVRARRVRGHRPSRVRRRPALRDARRARGARRRAERAHRGVHAHAPTAELLPLLERHGVPAAEVRSPREAVRDPRVLARGETVPLEHPRFGRVADVIGMGVPITFSDASAGCVRPAPSLGQDNELVYGDGSATAGRSRAPRRRRSAVTASAVAISASRCIARDGEPVTPSVVAVRRGRRSRGSSALRVCAA